LECSFPNFLYVPGILFQILLCIISIIFSLLFHIALYLRSDTSYAATTVRKCISAHIFFLFVKFSLLNYITVGMSLYNFSFALYFPNKCFLYFYTLRLLEAA
jgi:hypothetical protein